MKKHSVFALVSIIILLAASPSAAEILYYITDLGSGTANAINNGQVVGSSGAEAILFDTSGQGNSTNLGGGSALSINDSGQIVGRSGFNATLFDPTGGLQNITLGDGIACSINGSGQIVGVSGPGFPGTGPKAKIFNTHTELGGYWSAAYSNNDNGQIVGYATSIYRHATLFDSTGMFNNTDLGIVTGYNGSEARAINDYGDIVGFAGNYDEFGWCEEYTAVLFDETGGGSNIDLGTLDGFSYSWASSINNNDQIVGSTDSDLLLGRAVLFDPTGGGDNINLNSLIDPALDWTLTAALCINDDAWIVGSGYLNGNTQDIHAFLMTPIPEPATVFLLGIGVHLLRFLGRTRK